MTDDLYARIPPVATMTASRKGITSKYDVISRDRRSVCRNFFMSGTFSACFSLPSTATQ